MKLKSLLKDILKEDIVDQAFHDAKPVNEDGHTDVASAKRKMKLAMEDAKQLLEKHKGYEYTKEEFIWVDDNKFNQETKVIIEK